MELSIIIVSWNVKEYLRKCLGSIECQGNYNIFEVIVVDNASSDCAVDMVRADFPQVRLIANKDNKGFSAANNQGIKIAQGEYVFLLNPDTIIHYGCLEKLIKAMDDERSIGICGPKIVNSDGTICYSVGQNPGFRDVIYSKTIFGRLGLFRAIHKNNKNAERNFDYDSKGYVDQISGAAMMIRAEMLKDIGFLDEDFFMYYEDTELCTRAKKHGWKIAYIPNSQITHIGNCSASQVSAKKNYLIYSSLLTYFRKHKNTGDLLIFIPVFKISVLMKFIFQLLSSVLMLFVSLIAYDRRHKRKSLITLRQSASFLAKYSVKFIFCA